MTEPITPPVIATLCLPTVKAGATFRVYGKSRKPIEFRRHPKHQMLVREYTSAEEFHRDDRDIREALGSPYVITTLLGVTHPVIQAKEALVKLIGATQQVDITTRKAALMDLVEAAQAAIDRMDGNAVESPAVVATPSILAEPVPPPVAMRSAGWKSEDGVPVEAVKTQGGPQAVALGGIHTHAELMNADVTPMETLRAIAKHLGISLHQTTGGAKGRTMLVADVLAAEQQKAA